MKISQGNRWVIVVLSGLFCGGVLPGASVLAQDYDRQPARSTSLQKRDRTSALSEEEKRERMQVRRLYARGKQAVEAESYIEALKIFLTADRLVGGDPRILNMIGICYRKLGKLDEAFKYTEWALREEPNFPEARKHLGEAHLQAALVQIRMLQAYEKAGEQEVKDLKAAFRAAIKEMDKPPVKPDGKTRQP